MRSKLVSSGLVSSQVGFLILTYLTLFVFRSNVVPVWFASPKREVGGEYLFL